MSKVDRRGTRKRPDWLTPNLAILSFVSLMQDTASELLYPVLPVFLTVTLGAPVAVVGMVEGAAEAVAAITKVVAGKVADRRARRPLIAAGYGLAALGKLLVAVAFAWPIVLLGRAVDRVGKGLRSGPRDALLVEDIPRSARGRAFGLHRAADTTGAVIGPLLGLAAYQAFDQRIRPLLLVALVPAVVSVALVGLVRETPRPRPQRDPSHHHPHAAPLHDLPAVFWRAVSLVLAFSVVNFPDALVLLRLTEIGLSVPAVIVAYVVYNASYAALSLPAGLLADRLPPPRVLGLGLLAFALAYGGLGAVGDSVWVWPLLVVYGAFTASTDGVGKAWVSRLVGPDQQGRAQGFYQGASGGAVLVAGVWAGLAWGGTGRLPMLLAAGWALVVAAVLIVAGPKIAPTPS